MIDRAKFYKFIYATVSFRETPKFAKSLRNLFPNIEIPYVDLKTLNPNLKESLDSYFYIEADDKFADIYKSLCKRFPKISFTILGNIRGNDIFSFFTACKKANVETFKPGDPVKIIEGDFKNLSALVVEAHKDKIDIEFPLLNETKRLTCKLAEIIKHPNFIPMEREVFQSLEKRYFERGCKKAIILDGVNILYRSFCNIPNKYNSAGNFVGGFLGFFFTILKLKEMYPEFNLYCVLSEKDNCLPENASDRLKKAFSLNMHWVKEFVTHLGFNLVFSKEEPSKNLIGSLHAQLELEHKEILIYSSNEIYQSLLSRKTSIYIPKLTYRGNSEFLNYSQAVKLYGLKETKKIIWALCFIGKTEIPVTSISEYYVKKNGPKQNRIRFIEYAFLLHDSSTYADLKNKLKNDVNFSDFLPVFEHNYKKLKINDEISLDIVQKPYSSTDVIALLEEVEMYKEIELWDRTERIFQGMW